MMKMNVVERDLEQAVGTLCKFGEEIAWLEEAGRELEKCFPSSRSLSRFYSNRVAVVVEQALVIRSPFRLRTSAVSVEV